LKILIFTPVWRRPDVLRIYCAGIRRLRSEFNIDVFCVCSPEDDSGTKRILKENDIEYCEHPNVLGAKKNFGLEKAMERDFDYLLELNSDNIVKNELIESYLQRSEDFIACGNFAFVDLKTGRAKKYHFKKGTKYRTVFGIARMYKREAIEGLKLWKDNAIIGMDNHSEMVLSQNGVNPTIIDFKKPVAFDLKSDLNLWNYDSMKGEEIKFSKSGLSNEEKKLINAFG
jgi:hypothetical protein